MVVDVDRASLLLSSFHRSPFSLLSPLLSSNSSQNQHNQRLTVASACPGRARRSLATTPARRGEVRRADDMAF